MKNYFGLLLFSTLLIFISSCSQDGKISDAYGNFESVETIISAEASGKLLQFDIEEGTTVDSNKIIGLIDTVQLALKRDQLIASKNSIATKYSGVVTQINVLNQQKANLEKDKSRIDKMFSTKSATPKQVDDVNGAIEVIDKQISQIETQNPGIASELKSLDAQIAQVTDLIKKSIIINPKKGTVLNKFSEQYELVSPGKPLYKIADLSEIILRVYVDGSQLANIKIGNKVKVYIDQDKSTNRQLEGTVSWVSSKAEFTPKIIQTKDERVNMVYAVKINVVNDGSMKIGMPGEAKF